MNNLIYDIGFNDGSDTSFYLSKGFNVVGIDANPELIEKGRTKFKKEINEGRLILLNIGISNKNEILKFYINPMVNVWSSFNELLGQKQNDNNYSIDVECFKLSDIILKYGASPFYIKIDIEGYDRLALESLIDNPICISPYISVEASEEQSIHILDVLGYKKYKFINQGNISEQDGPDWSFNVGTSTPSGRFGEDTPGEWLSKEEIILKFQNTPQIKDWFDFHAKI